MLTYATDMTLLGTCMLPHGVTWMTGNVQTASLDHAVWLHEPFRFDEWLLYTTDSPWAGHARGFNRGRIYSRDGRLVASAAQEGLIRVRNRALGTRAALDHASSRTSPSTWSPNSLRRQSARGLLLRGLSDAEMQAAHRRHEL